MFSFLRNLFVSFNPANNKTFIGKQLKKPSGLLAWKVAKGMNRSNKKLYDLTFQNLTLTDNNSILEIGFGNGYFFDQLNRKNQRVTIFGAEISKEMIAQCTQINRKLIKDQKLNIKHYDGSILPFENEMFDKAIAINVIYFWDNPIENIKELNRVLKLNAELFIGVRPFNVLSQLPFAQDNFNIQPDHWWIEQFENVGFKFSNNLTSIELPIKFNGKSYPMSGVCWIFKKSIHVSSTNN